MRFSSKTFMSLSNTRKEGAQLHRARAHSLATCLSLQRLQGGQAGQGGRAAPSLEVGERCYSRLLLALECLPRGSQKAVTKAAA